MIDSTHIICLIMSILSCILIAYNYKMSCIENFLEEPDTKIVLYYANWCGYSKMFLPEWDSFENHAKNNIRGITVEKILCEGNDISKCSHLKGFPTVILHKNNKAITFNGNRTKSDLIKFIQSNV